MSNSKINYSYIEKIVSSAQFRNMQDKTQLFYSAPKRQVRTRLTHTIEVKVIARDIGIKINNGVSDELINLDLVDAIALSHDIGHTPFGHVGERTINDIVSRKDKLGGLLNDTGINVMRFKHNVNSYRILRNLNIEDWRIVEGALCHTKVFYKGDGCEFHKNPYDPFKEKPTKCDRFLQMHHSISSPPDTKKKLPSLTLEGQIVAIADEVAQRVADISDGLESRYFEIVKNILAINLNVSSRDKLELCIRETLIDDIVDTTLKNLKKAKPCFAKMDGIYHDVYSDKVVAFSEDMEKRNGKLETFITKMMAQSEDVRESDSRSRYIIRQLFKAYLNDVSLLPDWFLTGYFKGTINKSTFSAAQNKLSRMKEAEEGNLESAKSAKKPEKRVKEIEKRIKELEKKIEVFEKIKSGEWRYTEEMHSIKKVVVDMGMVGDYFAILTANEHTLQTAELNELFDEYILNIGFHIAGMTNTEAFTSYNRIYGH